MEVKFRLATEGSKYFSFINTLILVDINLILVNNISQ